MNFTLRIRPKAEFFGTELAKVKLADDEELIKGFKGFNISDFQQEERPVSTELESKLSISNIKENKNDWSLFETWLISKGYSISMSSTSEEEIETFLKLQTEFIHDCKSNLKSL